MKAGRNRSGFETGQVVKHKGVYHMFVMEDRGFWAVGKCALGWDHAGID